MSACGRACVSTPPEHLLQSALVVRFSCLYNPACGVGRKLPDQRRDMPQTVDVNPSSEHGLYLRLFVTNAGGW
jgi:hypothetical protein